MPFLPVGGQAVIEGVMMRSPSRVAVAVRRLDGSIAFMERPFISVTRRFKALGLPVVRGAVSLFETLSLGITALNFSADELTRAESGKAAKPSTGMAAAQLLTVGVGLALGVLLFLVLPARLTAALGFSSRVGFGLVDGLFRLLAFMGYLLLISQWKEMRRVLGYHGAEHKAIHAIEAGVPLTPENVQKFSRFHPRCGTTFLFYVVVVSIVVFSAIGRPHGLRDHLLRLAAMPIIAGVAFEFIRLSSRYGANPVVRALSWPGLQFQRLTTREPDLTMNAVAIAALEKVRGDEIVLEMERAAVPARAEVAFIQ
ncbi:MAG: DUF1385 domain-containing protein [Candidatus Eisenbacteria bacterium]|uniref:DUF1385 domain-containing protein n=1 Tax=Eiseniibacteriota bacterium TaxID=2212470 RepID=A0A538U2E2_UNCEI|nr:MAG: DUF1385 domain-containing protein [Candidatus Eisenbacteria bacterium]